jgi:hypothetical protein
MGRAINVSQHFFEPLLFLCKVFSVLPFQHLVYKGGATSIEFEHGEAIPADFAPGHVQERVYFSAAKLLEQV